MIDILNDISESLGKLNLHDKQISDILSHIRGSLPSDNETYEFPEHGWRCFHCGENFLTPKGARLHFGETPDKTPKCFNN
jgi:hypothetical protein